MEHDTILMAHGGGGELTHRLIEEIIAPRLSNTILDAMGDSAVLDPKGGRICYTTDSYVITPLIFPGGDIGTLAVCGTVNDLAVMGAVPKWLSLGFIIEEGLAISTLEQIVDSIARTARQAGVQVVTGDTKVIERTSGGNMYINTSGIGILPAGLDLSPGQIEPGDKILINGNLAEHGLAIMAVREGLNLQSELATDAAPLNGLIAELLEAGLAIRFIRDATRGGVAGLVADLAQSSSLAIEIEEARLPITRTARHVAELLGLDPLTIANEGKCVIVVSAEDADKAVKICQNHPLGKNVSMIGEVKTGRPGATLITKIGGRRVILRPYGEELPRIC